MSLVTLTSLALLALVPVAAVAGVPDPSRCTVPRALVFCPGGDIAASFVIRDFANNPEAGSSVVVEFGGCSNYHFCAHPFPDPSIVLFSPHLVGGTSQGNGSLSMRVAMVGGCYDAADHVQVYADGVLLAATGTFSSLVGLTSPDQNGDFAVDATDEGILTAKIAGGVDLTADLDANGIVDAADLDVLHAHLGHVCDSATPALRSRWGQLKLLYR